MESVQSIIQELEREAMTARRLLDLVPDGKLEWRPHEKSMSIGQLALHVASIPGSVSNMLTMDHFDVTKANAIPPQPKTTQEILSTFETGLERAKQILGNMDAEKFNGTWKMTRGDKEVFAMPRVAVARTVLLNHWYHHRGQLTVYLRLLNVPLPVTYGRSADTNPFE